MNAHDLAADLAARFSLRKRPRSWGGDCPSCSYHGAFSIKISSKAKRPILYCANGCTRDQLNETAQHALGSAWTPAPPVDEAEVAKARAAKQAAALRLWSGSTPCAGTPAAVYLARRGLAHLIASPTLRHRGDCWHAQRSRHPALIANVQDATGASVGVHRTYLDRDGTKANVDPPKASLGPIWGAAIRLADAAAELVIGEGLETAASAGLLLGLPAWAAITAGNMAAGLVLPEQVRTVTIAADPDPPGRRAAHDAAARWRAEGRAVRIATPDRPGMDFNDLLRERANA